MDSAGMARLRPLLLFIALTLLLASAASAQARVRIVGRVVDEQTGEPIRAADVVVRNTGDRFLRSATTDDMGQFEVLVYRTDAVRIFASRIGYRNSRTPVLWFDGHDFYQVELRLDPDVLLLAPLEVVARSEAVSSPVLAGYRERLQRGSGTYITRADVERRGPMYVTDLLADVPGVILESAGPGSRRVVRMSRSEARDCQVQVFLDGFLMNRGGTGGAFAIDDVVSPGSIEGIEVYRGLSTVPPEFLNPQARCGVVAIWTRRGTE